MAGSLDEYYENLPLEKAPSVEVKRNSLDEYYENLPLEKAPSVVVVRPAGNPRSALELVPSGLAADQKKSLRIAELSQVSGLPYDFVSRNLEDVERNTGSIGINARPFIAYAPTSANWATESEFNASAIREKTEPVGAWENALRAIHGKYTQGALQYEQVRLLEKEWDNGELSDVERKRLDSIRETLADAPRIRTGVVADAIAEAAGQFGNYRLMAEQALKYALGFGAASAAVGAASGGPLAIPFGWAGASFGAPIGLIKASGGMNGLLAWDEFRREPGMDPVVARNLAVAVGAINSVAELLGASAFLKLNPAARAVTRSAIMQVMKSKSVRSIAEKFGASSAKFMAEALSRVPASRYAAKAVKGLALSAATEGGTEAFQEYSQIIAGAVNRLHAEGELDANSLLDVIRNHDKITEIAHSEENKQRIRDAAVAGFKVSTVLGGASIALHGAYVGGEKLISHAKKARATKLINEEKARAIQASGLPPAIIEKIASEASEGASVYVPVKAWDEKIRSIGVDPDALAAIITGDQDAHARASEIGGDLQIPAGRYEAYISANKQLSDLFSGEARPDANDLSESEIISEDAQRKLFLEGMAEIDEGEGFKEVIADTKAKVREGRKGKERLEAEFMAMRARAIIEKSPSARDYAKLQEEIDTSVTEGISGDLQKFIEDSEVAGTTISEVEMEAIRREAQIKVDSNPARMSHSIFSKGTLPNGVEVPPIKINKKSAIAALGEDVVSSLSSKRPSMFSSSGGISIDDAVGIVPGISSPQQLADSVLVLKDRDIAIQEEIDAQIAERSSVELTDEQFASMIEKHAGADVREQYINRQIAFIADRLSRTADASKKLTGIPRSTPESRQFASEYIAGLTARQAAPSIFKAAMNRASRDAALHVARGDFARAMESKKLELENYEKYRAALDGDKSVEKTRRLFQRMDGKATRERLGEIPGILEMIYSITSAYDSRKGVDRSKADTSVSPADIEASTGITVPFKVADLDRSQKRNIRDVPLHELSDAYDAVKALDHIGSVAEKGVMEGRAKSLDETANAIVAQIGDKDAGRVEDLSPGGLNRLKGTVRSAVTHHMRVESIAEMIDGDESLGPTWDGLIRPIQAGRNKANVLQAAADKSFRELLSIYSDKERGSWWNKSELIPELGVKMSKPNLLALAMHSSSNMDVLSNGRPNFTPENVSAAIKNHLDEKDARFVQGTLDWIGSYWDEASAMHRRLTSAVPKKADFSPINVGGVDIKGGYFPRIASKDESTGLSATAASGVNADAGNISEIFGADGVSTMVEHGYLTERSKGSTIKVALNLASIKRHVDAVIHDLSFREPVIDVANLIRRKDFSSAVTRAYGPEVYRELKPWLKAIAKNKASQHLNGFDSMVGAARTGTSSLLLGLRLTTGLVQAADMSRVVGSVGARWMGHGLKTLFGHANPANTIKAFRAIDEKSSFVRSRVKQGSGYRDLNQAFDAMGVPGETFGTVAKINSKLNTLRALQFAHIAAVDKSIVYLAWQSAYDKAMAGAVRNIDPKSKNIDSEAILYADSIVRGNLGSGLIEDLAQIERGPEIWKWFTMFMTPQIVMFDQYRKFASKVKSGDVAGATNALLWYVILPVVLEEAIRTSWKPGEPEDEDGDEVALRYLTRIATAPAESVVLLREVVKAGRFGKVAAVPALESIASGYLGAESLAKLGLSELGVLDEEYELSNYDIKNIVAGASVFSRLPLKNAKITLDGAMKWYSGDEEPDSFKEAMMLLFVNGSRRDN